MTFSQEQILLKCTYLFTLIYWGGGGVFFPGWRRGGGGGSRPPWEFRLWMLCRRSYVGIDNLVRTQCKLILKLNLNHGGDVWHG